MSQLSYSDTGGNNTPIVFIHGLGSRKEAWVHQQPLSSKYRLISLDLWGHGETIMDDELTVKNFASDIANLLDFLNIKSAYVCGLSLGGIVAQELHVQRSDLIKGLILANTTSYIPSLCTHSFMSESTRAFKDGSLIDKIVKRGLVNEAYADDARKAFYIRDSYLESAKAAIGLNYFPSLHDIKKPTLIIGSYRDKVMPVANVSLMQFCIRNSKSVIFRGTGHLSNIEQAEKFNQSLIDFIGA